MATVSLETARRARSEARRLRLESHALRLAVRRQLATSHARMAGAQAEVGRVRARCTAPVPSPWSELSWRLDDASLDRILVPLR